MRFKAVFILVLLAGGLRAQGLVLNDQAYRTTAVMSDADTGAKGSAALSPNGLKVDLKPYCPSVQAQGKISSCVGWSVGYAAMTIEKAIMNSWAGDRQTIDDNAFSAMFVYNQVKLGDCFFGAELNQALQILKEKGNVFYRDFSVGNNCDSLPAGKLVEKARVNRVKDFVALFDPDDRDEVKIERVKRTLAHQKPVVIGMIVLDNFLTLKSTDQVWYPNVGKTDLFGGHAMVVVGFDEGRKAFEVMNSWGEGWANGGFVWVRYEDFAKYCKYAYQLVLENEKSSHLEGTLRVLRPVVKSATNGEIDVTFSPVKFEFKNDQYALKDDGVRLPLEFQLQAEDFRADSYLYIISFDRELKPVVHWPRDEKLNRHFAGDHDSPLVSAHHSTITLPGKYNVFTIQEAGTEYLCVLNANAPVRNLPEKLRQIGALKGEVSDRVRKVFSIKSVGSFNSFENDRITFLSSGEKPGIVSVLLKFETK